MKTAPSVVEPGEYFKENPDETYQKSLNEYNKHNTPEQNDKDAINSFNESEIINNLNLEIISKESSIGLVIIIFIIYLLYNYLQLEKLNLNLLYVQFFLLHFFYHQY